MAQAPRVIVEKKTKCPRDLQKKVIKHGGRGDILIKGGEQFRGTCK